jgi:ADP-ribose pyrophosphatase
VIKTVPKDAILIPAQASRLYQGVIFDVYQWPQTLFDGSTATFEMLRRPDTVVVIPVIEDHIILLEDEQPNRGPIITLPGGRVESADESTLAAVKRELREETGYLFERWQLVDVIQPQRKIEWFVHVYVASGACEQVDPQSDSGERITVQSLPFDDVKRLAADPDCDLYHYQRLFQEVHRAAGLVALPAFQGCEVDC